MGRVSDRAARVAAPAAGPSSGAAPPAGTVRRAAAQATYPYKTPFRADVVIAYRWHPLYGQRATRLRDQQMNEHKYVLCRLSTGKQHLLPAWMLEASLCAQHESGAPMLSLPALQELRRVLDSLRSSSLCDGLGQNSSPEDSLGTETTSSTAASSSLGNCRPTPNSAAQRSGSAGPDSGGAEPLDSAPGPRAVRRRRTAGGRR